MISGFATVLRSLLRALGIVGAAAMWPARAHADWATDSTSAQTANGLGDNCPLLAGPGAALASTARRRGRWFTLTVAMAVAITITAISLDSPALGGYSRMRYLYVAYMDAEFGSLHAVSACPSSRSARGRVGLTAMGSPPRAYVPGSRFAPAKAGATKCSRIDR
jgi:hypothetical protein